MQRRGETVKIAVADGVMPAVVWTPGAPVRRPGVLVLPDAYGLTSHVESVAECLAERGYVALAPDLYYRSELRRIPYDDPGRAADRVMRTIALSEAPEERAKDERILCDVASALDALGSHPEVDPEALGVIGFGLGGHLAFLAACRFPRELRVAVLFYADRMVPILCEARRLGSPVLMFFGGRDGSIPMPQIDRIRAELEYLEKPYEIRVYTDAGSGFFCEQRDTHAPDCAAEAWEETQEWLRKNLR